MILEHDAIGYENMGRLIYQHGLGEYLRTGPHREPLYPILIALAMFLGEKLSINYQAIIMFLQMFVIFVTQQLMLKILKKLNVNEVLSASAIFYIGISPAIVN